MKNNLKISILVLTALLSFFIIFNVSPFLVSTQIIVLLILLVLGGWTSILSLEDNYKNKHILIFSLSFLGIILFLTMIRSPLFLAKEYTNILKTKNINVKNFIVNNPEKIRKVTRNMALVKANKILGIKSNGVEISTQFQLDKGNIIKYKGKEYWIFSLEPSTIFSWLSNKKIPGYILVSATNPDSKAKFINKPYLIGKSYLWNNIERIAYFSTFFSPTNIHFEIDNKGNPYWIIIKEKYKYYGNLLFPESIKIVNAVNGNIEFNDLVNSKNIPKWVDKIIPEDISKQIIEYYGKYQNGYLNSLFTQKNVVIPTIYKNKELWLIENNINNNLMWFTGVTSPNKKDNSLISAISIDTKTMKMFKLDGMSGITDEKGAIEAIDSSLGANSIKWEPVLPNPIIINNEFYWIASIINKQSNIYQKEGAVKGNDITKVIIDKSLKNILNIILINKTIKKTNKQDKKIIILKKIQKIQKELDELKKLLGN